VADDLVFRQIHHRRLTRLPYRRQVLPSRMATPVVVPILAHPQEVVQMPFVHHAKRVEHLMLQRLNHPLNDGLQIRRPRTRLLDLAAG